MKSMHGSATLGALQLWVPSERRPGQNFRNETVKDSNIRKVIVCSNSLKLSFWTPVRTKTFTKAIGGTLIVESDQDPRKENKKTGSVKYNKGQQFILNWNELDVKSEKNLRRAGLGAKAYLELLLESTWKDGGPPRWFCPLQNQRPPPNAPLLLFLPGIAGTGFELLVQQETLGRLFELCCLHIPMMDHTPFEGFVSIIEDFIYEGTRLSPGRPIYLVGDNFGGALALAVAARNPDLDLVLILVNPSTSYDRSPLEALGPIFQSIPPPMFSSATLLLGFLMSDPIHFASSKFASNLLNFESFQQVSEFFLGIFSALPNIANSLSKDTVLWKLQLLHSSAQYVNSRLHGVRAEVLVLASIRDQLLPSLDEAKRLSKTLLNCTYRQFDQSSHLLLMDFDLASVIKGTCLYRQTSAKDVVTNYVPPTQEEIIKLYDSTKLLRRLFSPVFFSTGDDGVVVQGLAKIPCKGPLIFVGYHSLLGLDMKILGSELMMARQLLVRALAHPTLFQKQLLEDFPTFFEGDLFRLFGIVPVSGKNMYKLLARGDNILLYPGGAREALHRKGEAHKLFWPEQAEFVKMAAKFGATIIPMCTVGEDEILEILMDFDEMTSIPVLGQMISDFFKGLPTLRTDKSGEVSKQILHMPVVAPKLSGPGRLYLLFGQPIYTEEKREYYRLQKNIDATFQKVKENVEGGITYLLEKRQKDPYRNFIPRVFYEFSSEGTIQAPTFEP